MENRGLQKELKVQLVFPKWRVKWDTTGKSHGHKREQKNTQVRDKLQDQCNVAVCGGGSIRNLNQPYSAIRNLNLPYSAIWVAQPAVRVEQPTVWVVQSHGNQHNGLRNRQYGLSNQQSGLRNQQYG